MKSILNSIANTLIAISLTCFAVYMFNGYYGTASPSQLKMLDEYAHSLDSHRFNQSLTNALSDGVISLFDFYRLQAEANEIKNEHKKQ